MLRNSFLLALIASAAQAVHLRITEPEEPKASLTEGPEAGFPTDNCDANIPADMEDPVCWDS